MKKIVVALLLSLPAAALAQPVAPAAPPRAQAEIDYLFDYISRSTCQFNRNGSWHDMATARAHLGTKFEYLRERGGARTAEAFIENAATRSSLSGKVYLVQCPGSQPVPSADWLKSELARFRARQG